MNRFAQRSGNAQGSTETQQGNEEMASLYHYPSLGRLFEQPQSEELRQMRARLERTSQDLERVVRQGSREDAERAARAARAYETVLGLLSDLEKLQREGGGA